MPLFFSMSLAGSIPLCIGLLIMILQKEQTSFYYVNSLFKLSVILYLLPLQLIKNIPASSRFSCSIFPCAAAFLKFSPVKQRGEHISSRRS